ncbi:MAG: Selenophosphate-dependent tRNA 2-selenouridine synthase [Burkholderiaceae bacterium]|nr:MAG: Selenophosphate-dependent tRNA 2-selenouridine synthase [Burkholderiaceae bacterium]
MSIVHVAAAQAIVDLGGYSAIIDARSESEYAEDHLPGALNWPSLNDEERRIVGTLYRQAGAFDANKRGAALVAANIARHIERELQDKTKHWKPLVYCWRGGKRSGALALVLSQIGLRVAVLDGGYKAYRNALLADLPRLVQRLSYRVVCGPTGSGKTRLLHALQGAGAQVLDLEALACHRSSVLGQIPGQTQPSQKRFDTLVWDLLRRFDPEQPVFVESESRKIGNLAVPEALILAMRAAACLDLQLPDDERVALLMEDYDFLVAEPLLLCSRLDALIELRGKAVVQGWKQKIAAGRVEEMVRHLLRIHYDPGYARSMAGNFSRYGASEKIAPRDRSTAAMSELAREIVSGARNVSNVNDGAG